jgi:hypothetical protein
MSLESPSELPLDLANTFSFQSLRELQVLVEESLKTKPTSSSQEAVIGMLLHRQMTHLTPIWIPDLVSLSGVSVPTTYAAIKKLDPKAWSKDKERAIALRSFSADAWKQWLLASSNVTKARFVDRSGSPRSPRKLAEQVRKLGRGDIAIGGVLDAMHHFSGLDMTAATRLDLVVQNPSDSRVPSVMNAIRRICSPHSGHSNGNTS